MQCTFYHSWSIPSPYNHSFQHTSQLTMTADRNVQFIDDGAASSGQSLYSKMLLIFRGVLTGMFQSPGWTPPKEQPQSSSGEYHFYDFQENYLMVPASDGSSGWSPPDQLPTSPTSNSMSLDTSDHHTIPMVESLLGNQLQGDWSPPTKSPSREWDPPSLPQMPIYYHGNDQGRLLQSSTQSSCNTGTSDDGHGWTPSMQVPALMPPRMPTSQPQTPIPHCKHAGRTPPFHCSSDSSSDTNTSEDSGGWTPPLEPTVEHLLPSIHNAVPSNSISNVGITYSLNTN